MSSDSRLPAGSGGSPNGDAAVIVLLTVLTEAAPAQDSADRELEKILVFGAEMPFSDGPWENAEDVNLYNLLAKYSTEAWGKPAELIATFYSNDWKATDQIPLRALTAGELQPMEDFHFHPVETLELRLRSRYLF